MTMPLAYEPEQGYMYQILCRNPEYDREWESCDYAVDKQDLKYLLENYRMAYPSGFQFKYIKLPKKYWGENK